VISGSIYHLLAFGRRALSMSTGNFLQSEPSGPGVISDAVIPISPTRILSDMDEEGDGIYPDGRGDPGQRGV
jgi:hypothetical protein